MNNLFIPLFLLSLLCSGCNKYNDPFEVNTQETAFTFYDKSPYYDDKGVKLDSSLFTDSAFKYLEKGRIYSLAKTKLHNTHSTLLIKQTPKRKHLDNHYFLVNFDENKKPIDIMYIYRPNMDINRVEITADTIFSYIDYGGSVWVEKSIINKNGEFIHLGDERIWVKPEKKIKRTYEEMMQDMP